MLGLAADVHPNAVAFATLFLLALALPPAARPTGAWRLFAVGLVIGGAVYLASRVAPDPAGFAASFGFWVGVEKRPPILDGTPLSALVEELRRFSEYFASRPLELAVIAVGVAWSAQRALRGSCPHRLVLLGLLGAYLVFSALVASKVQFYLVLYQPLLCLLVGAALADLAGGLAPRPIPAAVATVALALFGFGLLGYARDLAYRANTGDHDYPLLASRLRDAVPAHAVVVGQPLYWPALSDRRFVDIGAAERLRRERGVGLEQFLRDSGATVVLIDDDTRGRLPSADRAWLGRASDHVLAIEQKYYGTIDVRHLREGGR
jgi:hypothetical protein